MIKGKITITFKDKMTDIDVYDFINDFYENNTSVIEGMKFEGIEKDLLK